MFINVISSLPEFCICYHTSFPPISQLTSPCQSFYDCIAEKACKFYLKLHKSVLLDVSCALQVSCGLFNHVNVTYQKKLKNHVNVLARCVSHAKVHGIHARCRITLQDVILLYIQLIVDCDSSLKRMQEIRHAGAGGLWAELISNRGQI